MIIEKERGRERETARERDRDRDRESERVDNTEQLQLPVKKDEIKQERELDIHMYT